MENLSSRIWKHVLGFIIVAAASATAQTYTFTTIAGNAGYGSADGDGSAARFNGPIGLAFDTAGNLFVTDYNSQTIRKMTLSGGNWTVMTVAGTAGFIGSANGTNGTARFNSPLAITADAGGNLFVAEAGNNLIRKITPVGPDWITTTIAGQTDGGFADGTNTDALFARPQGIATDANGNLLVADTGNFTIRKITSSGANWITRTLAGTAGMPGSDDGTNSTALFNGSIGIARDTAGNIYLADSGSHTIRKLTLSGITNWVSSTITGVAGVPGSADGTNSDALFNSPTGLATDSSGNIYVAEYGNNTVRKIAHVGTNWIVTTIAGQAGTSGSADGTNNSSRFFQPFGVAVNASGSVFVADLANNTIRKIMPSGPDWITTTIAGLAGGSGKADGTNFSAQFSDPHHAVTDAAGNIYVADSGNYAIRKLAKVGSNWVVTTISGLGGFLGSSDGTNNEARFFYPYGLTIDAQSNLFVADTFNFAIRKIRPDGTNWITSTIAGQIGGLSGFEDGTNTDARFAGPEGIAADMSGDLFVADTSGHTIRKLTKSGTNWITSTIAGQLNTFVGSYADGTNNAAHFKFPSGVAVNSSGEVFVADSGTHTIRKLVLSGTNWIVKTIAGFGNSAGSNDGTNQTARFRNPFSLAVTTNGSLIVADLGNNTVRKITPSGANWITTTIGGLAGVYDNLDGTGTNAHFTSTSGVAVNSADQIFVICSSSIMLGEASATIMIPMLQIIKTGNKAILSWPQWASDFNLETTSPLKTSASWTNRPGAVLIGTNFMYTNTINGGSEFFRLRKP